MNVLYILSLEKSRMTYKDRINVRGIQTLVDAIQVDNKALIISGQLIKMAKLKDEWCEDVHNPEAVIRILKDSSVRIDLFSFWQRLPETAPTYDYYREWEYLAAIPIRDYDHWWKEQINSKTRNMVRKPGKRGVVIKEAPFNDQLVAGIVKIFNESPVRRGKPFWHYKKDFNTVKNEMSADPECSIFIGAFYETELIGFIKLLRTDRYAIITMILDLIAYRDKSPMNGMIAKAVEICAVHHIPYLTYTVWRRGNHGDFQSRNGFERIPVPRYYVPLTLTGQLALKLNLHRGLKGLLPERVVTELLNLRAKWYSGKDLY